MAKKEEFAENKKNFPFATLRKGAVCALVGATALAGGLLVGCDDGSVEGPAGVNFYYGVEAPNDINKEGKVGDFYIETDDGDVWQLTAEGWVEISNIKGPQGEPGNTPTISISQDGYWVINGVKSNIKAEGEQGEPGDPGEQGVSVVNVTLQPYADKDGNTYMDYTFHYSNDTTTTERVYTGSTIYVGEEMTLEKALEVVAIGGTVELKTDVELEKVLVVNKKATIDLAGHYIYNETTELWNDTEELNDWSLISVREGGDLTIEDSGVLVEYQGEYGPETYTEYGGLYAMEGDCYAIDVQEGAKCTINGGEETIFAGNISSVYVHTGELVVNGGCYIVQQLDPNTGDERYTLNCYNENYKNGTAKITVNGGMYLNFDPTKAGDDGDYLSSENMAISFPTEMDEPGQFATMYQVVPIDFAMQMLQAIPAGMPVSATLGGDMVLPAQGIVINDGVDLTIDLNGHTVSAPNDEAGDGVFHVLAGGKLTINDSTGAGRIDAECKSVYKMAVWADGGEVIINGGTFTNATTDGTETQYDMMYVKNGGIITINGGTFDCKTPKWTLNSHNDYTGTFVVNGGTFKNYNPSASMTDENDGNVPPTNFVAEGYVVVEETVGQDTWYTVVDLQEFVEEAEAGAIIKLASDVVLDAQLSVDKEITLDLNGHTISNTEDVWDVTDKEWSLISVAGGNLTIKNGTVHAKENDCYAIDVRNGGNLVIESGQYVGNVHAIYVYEGSATISGGEFDIQQLSEVTGDSRYTLNCFDANYKNGSATISVTGGRFANYNPQGSTSENPTANFVAEGYTVEHTEPGMDTTDIWYTVVEDAE